MQFFYVENNIDNNYSPQRRWLLIYSAAKRRGKFSPLANDTEVNNCVSTYYDSEITAQKKRDDF